MTNGNLMHNELTNLLPLERQHSLRRDYFLRLGVVILTTLVALLIASAVLLVPTYVFLAGSAREKEARLAHLDATLSSSDEVALSAQLTALSERVATLSALAGAPSISGIMRSVLIIPRPGIILSGFEYAPATDKSAATLAVSGRAATRDALRSYQLALQNSSLARSADLPVSAYAKDADIAFTITVTLAP